MIKYPGRVIPKVNGNILVWLGSGGDLQRIKLITAFTKAFQMVSRYTAFPLKRTFDPSKAYIKIFFDKKSINGFNENAIARGIYPGSPDQGKIFVNPVIDLSRYNIEKIFCHEIGHTLNIDHDEQNENDIMFPKYQRDKPLLFSEETKNALFDATK